MGRMVSAAAILLASALVLAVLAACAEPATPAATATPLTTATPTARLAGATVTASLSPTATPPQTATLPAASPTAARTPTTAAATPRAEPTARVAEVGYLEGRVTVGPLTPVERIGVPTPTPSPETCTSRGLAIYDVSGNAALTSFRFRPDCTYRVALPAGRYVVRLDPQPPIGGSKDLPKTVAIESGKTTTVNIDIDTGIR